MCKKFTLMGLIIYSFINLVAVDAFAADLDQSTVSAIADTQAMLSDPQARAKAVQADPNAVRADQNLKNLGLKKESEEKAYQISGKIMEKMVKETGGDPVALQKKMAELLRNPAGLEKELDPESREAISKMAQELDAPKKQP